ncbi:VOC family protein [Streptomyces sp. NPDC091272]|uniref:VOC family protein n=1 Tax=Streptomyces sp. NPDC091272 TaxID=3365981 RepID=UPI003827EF84
MTPRLDAVSIVTADLAASLDFYRRLGVPLPADAASQPHVEAVLPGGLRLLWDTEDVISSFDPAWEKPQGGERLGLAFLCGSAAEVDATYDDLIAAGYSGHLKPWNAQWGQRYAVVLDPDGLGVSLFAAIAE